LNEGERVYNPVNNWERKVRQEATVHWHLRIIGITAILFLAISAPAIAQRTGQSGSQQGIQQPAAPSPGVGTTAEMFATGSVVVRVLGARSAPLKRHAFVAIFANGSGVPLRTEMTSGDSQVIFANLPGFGRYTVEVNATGYRTERKDLDYNDSHGYIEVDVTMEPNPENVAAKATPSQPIPAKAQKHEDKGLAELEAGNLKNSQKELLEAYTLAPKDAEINYLLGSLYVRLQDVQQAETYFNNSVKADPENVPALVALGQMRHNKGDFKGASEVLEKASALDGKEWLARWLLSDIYLHAGDFKKAQREAVEAVEMGKGAANAAELIEGEALAELGQTQDALKVLRAFLRDVPGSRSVPAAQELVDRLEHEISDESATNGVTQPTPVSSALPSAEMPAPKLPLADWEPPGVDQVKPVTADGVACPADQVIGGVGKRVTELVESVNRIQAKEDVIHQELSTMGRPILTDRRKFEYLISITPSDSGVLVIDENRQGDSGSNEFLGRVSMFGLADLPLIFSPEMRGDFQMTCEGLGSWHDQPTWLVYFRQREDRPERIRAYQNQDGSYTVGLKGRAWISADTYQIVRLEANLMKPIPEVGLGSEEDAIEYGPVPFPAKNVVLWLPANADIYFYYHHRPFHRHHTFSKYLLFSVSATQKIGEPKIPEQQDNPR
jgi:tetratricopeptide (TPR) repeat protein